jgi:hypothetical protein
MHKISIIIPLNTSKKINKVIYSALNQNYQDFQILIITDKNIDLIQNKKITVIKVQKNCNIPTLLNIGIEASDSKYVCFLNPNDLLLYNALKNRYQEFQKNNDLAVCYGFGIDTDNDYQVIQNQNYQYFSDNIRLPENNIRTALSSEMDLSFSSFMIKKDILMNLKFDPALKTTYIWDFIIKLFNNYGENICQINEPVYISSENKYNNQSNFINYLKEANNLLDDYFKKAIQENDFNINCFRRLYYYMFSILIEYYPSNFWLRFYLLASYLNKNKQLENKLFEFWFLCVLFNSVTVAKNSLLKQKIA